MGTIERVMEALGATMDVTVRWHGERLDRLVDAGHAAIVERTTAHLASLGWLCRPEVSFNHFGDRGLVDVVAIHVATRMVMIVEVKTAIGDVQAMLGRLDVKARLGRTIAESVGWTDARAVAPAFVIANTRTARRCVLRHEHSFRRYSLRGRSALAWLRNPRLPAPSGLLRFVNVPDVHGVSVKRGRRVRTANNGR